MMSTDDMYKRILTLLMEYQGKFPSYYMPSSMLRSKLSIPIDTIRTYVDDLFLNGYVDKEDWFTTTFIVRITKKGIEAIEKDSIVIENRVNYMGDDKVKILKLLRNEQDLGNPYYVPGKIIIESLKINETTAYRLAKELSYAGYTKKIESTYPHFTLQITKKGILFLDNLPKENFII